MRFSGDVLGSRVAWYAYSNSDFLVAGRMLGQAPLGAYTLAWTIASTPVEKITNMITRVTPAFFSAVQDDKPHLRRYLLGITDGLSLLTFPASLGMALVADQFVLVVLGAKWAPAIIPLAAAGGVRGDALHHHGLPQHAVCHAPLAVRDVEHRYCRRRVSSRVLLQQPLGNNRHRRDVDPAVSGDYGSVCLAHSLWRPSCRLDLSPLDVARASRRPGHGHHGCRRPDSYASHLVASWCGSPFQCSRERFPIRAVVLSCRAAAYARSLPAAAWRGDLAVLRVRCRWTNSTRS